MCSVYTRCSLTNPNNSHTIVNSRKEVGFGLRAVCWSSHPGPTVAVGDTMVSSDR